MVLTFSDRVSDRVSGLLTSAGLNLVLVRSGTPQEGQLQYSITVVPTLFVSMPEPGEGLVTDKQEQII